MEASQHSLLAACFTLHSINATLSIVPQRGPGLWINLALSEVCGVKVLEKEERYGHSLCNNIEKEHWEKALMCCGLHRSLPRQGPIENL
jgi:hypothetical protein